MNRREPITFEQGLLSVGAAAAANRKATETAILIMEAGGNAVDAAICQPCPRLTTRRTLSPLARALPLRRVPPHRRSTRRAPTACFSSQR